jgi:hypothetical protein
MMAVVHDLAEAQGTIDRDNPTRRRVAYNVNTHLFPSTFSGRHCSSRGHLKDRKTQARNRACSTLCFPLRAADDEAGGASLGGHAKLRA